MYRVSYLYSGGLGARLQKRLLFLNLVVLNRRGWLYAEQVPCHPPESIDFLSGGLYPRNDGALINWGGAIFANDCSTTVCEYWEAKLFNTFLRGQRI